MLIKNNFKDTAFFTKRGVFYKKFNSQNVIVLLIKLFKLVTLTVLAMCVQINVWAEETLSKMVTNDTSPYFLESSDTHFVAVKMPEQLEAERQAVEKVIRLEEKKRFTPKEQALAEQTLVDKIGKQKFLFKAQVARIYWNNDYQLLWRNQETKIVFLKQYAAMVASGISKRAAVNLKRLDEILGEGDLLEDALFTDTFLDYLYYAQNVQKFAQKWLYKNNAYRSVAPTENQIDAWLVAVSEKRESAFIENLTSHNPLYISSLNKLMSSDEMTPAERQKLAINIQRLRILPEFKNGLFVNIPSYQLNYYRDGELVLTSRVIVGTTKRKTPVMLSKLSNVVVNPPWNAPARLINEDIIPKVRRDPSYLERNAYTILDSQGNVVDPYSIDWENMEGEFPYRLRQAPGNSALGNFKFNMPSSDAIYLHDTPNKGLFTKSKRHFSSGCVRVEQADQLASILLEEAGWSNEKKLQVLASKKTRSVNVQSDNPVYLYYVTLWADQDGVLYSLPDIYGYDRKSVATFIAWDIVDKYLHN